MYLGRWLAFIVWLRDARRAPVGQLHVLLSAEFGLAKVFLSAEFGLTLLVKELVLLRDDLLTLALCMHGKWWYDEDPE